LNEASTRGTGSVSAEGCAGHSGIYQPGRGGEGCCISSGSAGGAEDLGSGVAYYVVGAADDIAGVALGVTQAGHMTAPDRGGHPRSLLLRRGRPHVTLGTQCHGPFWVDRVLREDGIERRGRADSPYSPAHAQDRKGSTRKPTFPHARPVIYMDAGSWKT
jgi:hypothetical protein